MRTHIFVCVISVRRAQGNMASGKKSTLLSSLAAYGDDSEQESDLDTDEQGTVLCLLFKITF